MRAKKCPTCGGGGHRKAEVFPGCMLDVEVCRTCQGLGAVEVETRHYAAIGATVADALLSLAQGCIRDGVQPILSTLDAQPLREATIGGRTMDGSAPSTGVRLYVEVEW